MSWQLFDRLRVLFKQANIYNYENLHQNQADVARLTAGGKALNLATYGVLLEQTNLQINRLERFKDYDQMSEMGEISFALDAYADESTLIESEYKHNLLIRSKHKRVKNELSELFYSTLCTDNLLRTYVRYLCKYGDLPMEIVPTKNRDGVAALRHMNVYNFSRIETKKGDLIGFFYQDEGDQKPNFLHPWQVVHFRIDSLENIFKPYGASLMEGARKDFKRLRLMEDAALIYRIVRSPERRVFKIPVGEIPAQHVPTYMEMFARNIKKKRFYNPNTGQIDERWSPLIQEDDYYLPRRPDGSGPEVDTLPGGENLDQIADIEYFKKKMISALKIPFSRVGLGEAGEDSRQSLSQVAPEFAKAVQFIQRIVACGLQKVALVHLGLKGFSVNEMKSTELYLPASSAIDELYRIEKWATRADVIANLKDTGLFSPEWILKTFTDMSSDEIAAMQKEVASLPQEPGLGEPPLPTESVEAPLKVEEDKLLSEYADFQKRTKAVNEEVKIEHNMLQNLLTMNELDGLNNGKKTLVEHRIDVKSELFESTYKEGEASFLFEQATFKKQAQIEKERRELLGPYVENPEITDKDIPA